jgi:hypothetical protein
LKLKSKSRIKTKTKEIRGPEGHNNIAMGPGWTEVPGMSRGWAVVPALEKAAKEVKQDSANFSLFHGHSKNS